uniref:Probable RNA polymerase II nuclear localization protein SLC7A6OS n=1 Tax=Trichuris muris TaxID=70415 RepID=A0A5S6QPK9_TRIMR
MQAQAITNVPCEGVTTANSCVQPVVLRVKRKTESSPNSSLIVVPKKCRLNGGDDGTSIVTSLAHTATCSTTAELVTSLKRVIPLHVLDELATSSKRLRVIDLEVDDEFSVSRSHSLTVTGNECVELDKTLLDIPAADDVPVGERGMHALLSEFGAIEAFDENEPSTSKPSAVSLDSSSTITVNGIPMTKEVLKDGSYLENPALRGFYDYYVADACDESFLNWDMMTDDIAQMAEFEIVGNPCSVPGEESNFLDEFDSEDSNAENYFRNDYPDEDFEDEEKDRSDLSGYDSYDS